jgi:anti-anti-sigma factor
MVDEQLNSKSRARERERERDCRPKRVRMLLRIQKLGDVTIIHCAGRMAYPHATDLRSTILRQLRPRTLVLELAETVAIDAAGLGGLIGLCAWAKETRTAFKLMNLTPKVEELLQLAKLRSAFDVCSAREMLQLLCRAIMAMNQRYLKECFKIPIPATGRQSSTRSFSE